MSSEVHTSVRRPVPDDLFGGRLRGAYLLDLEVVDVHEVATHVRSITMESSDLVGFEYKPGQDLMIEFPDGERSVRRRYTVRRADTVVGLAELEFELHGGGGGVATRWASEAKIGDRLSAIGPRGSMGVRLEATAHVFVTDDSAMPATFAMLEALPDDASATVLLVTHGPLSRPGPNPAAHVRQLWLDHSELGMTIPQLDLTTSLTAYVNGEHHFVRSASGLLAMAGIDEAAISTKSYWRRDQPNAPHGEPARD